MKTYEQLAAELFAPTGDPPSSEAFAEALRDAHAAGIEEAAQRMKWVNTTPGWREKLARTIRSLNKDRPR